MSTVMELRNEAREALAKASAAIKEGNQEQYDAFWKEYTDKLSASEKLDQAEQAQKALYEKSPDLEDIRNPGDAAIVKSDAVTLVETKDTMFRAADGTYVSAATKDSEGYIRGYPAAVQHPEIMKRYGPELREEAKFYSDAFITYIRKGPRYLDAKQLKALQENTDSEGGYLVPTDQVKLPFVHDPGVGGGTIRPISSNFNTTRDAGNWPTVGSVAWASVAEEAAVPSTTDPVFGQVAFSIKKIMGHHKVSTELLEDSAVDIAGILNLIYGESLARYEDQQAIEGDGTTEPEGIRTSGGTDATGNALVDASDGWDARNIIAQYFQLQDTFRPNSTWHTTSTTAAQIFALGQIVASGTATQLHFMPAGGNVAPVLTLMGRPVALFDGTGWDTTLSGTNEYGCLGDFSQYYFINRVGMTIRRLDELYAGNDQVGFVARIRYDGVVALDTAFLIMKGEA